MRRTLLLASLIGSLLNLSPSSLFAANAELDCAHGVVQRAGVALVKKYPNSKPGLDTVVFVGVHPHAVFNHNQHGAIPRVNFFGGSCDTTDKSSAHAAVRELYEETSKAVKLDPSALNNAGYVYSGDKKAKGAPDTPGFNYIQMFFLRDDNLSASQISKVQSAALKNPKLAHHFKETKETVAIPLQDLLDRAQYMANLQQTGQTRLLDHPNTYIFETRGDGQGNGRQKVFMERHYLKNVARDIIRDANNFPGICARLMASTAAPNPAPAPKAAPAPKPAPKKAAPAPKAQQAATQKALQAAAKRAQQVADKILAQAQASAKKDQQAANKKIVQAQSSAKKDQQAANKKVAQAKTAAQKAQQAADKKIVQAEASAKKAQQAADKKVAQAQKALLKAQQLLGKAVGKAQAKAKNAEQAAFKGLDKAQRAVKQTQETGDQKVAQAKDSGKKAQQTAAEKVAQAEAAALQVQQAAAQKVAQAQAAAVQVQQAAAQKVAQAQTAAAQAKANGASALKKNP